MFLLQIIGKSSRIEDIYGTSVRWEGERMWRATRELCESFHFLIGKPIWINETKFMNVDFDSYKLCCGTLFTELWQPF